MTFAYDAGGLRIRKGATTYQLDGSRILSETRPTGTVWYYYDNGGICGFKYNNVRYYYEKNLQGDITAIYDGNGNKKAEYQYDAWGNHTITVNIDGIAILNPFRYRGYYFDTETGVYYLNSRYYDPQTGRFINADVQLNTNSLFGYNLFTYCNNNPAMFVDPSGKSGVLFLVGAGALLLLAFGATEILLIDGAAQASQDIAKTHSITLPESNSIDITFPTVLDLIGYLSYKSRAKEAEREIEKAKERERTSKEGPIYYHVTSAEIAAEIMSTGIITPGEGGFVYAWRSCPSSQAINYSGARFVGSGSVIISFRTNAAFEGDPEINRQTYPYGPVRTYIPGAIKVTDVHIVKFN